MIESDQSKFLKKGLTMMPTKNKKGVGLSVARLSESNMGTGGETEQKSSILTNRKNEFMRKAVNVAVQTEWMEGSEYREEDSLSRYNQNKGSSKSVVCQHCKQFGIKQSANKSFL